MEAPKIKYILFEYLSGRVNPLERKLVEDWLNDEENIETFHLWLLEWENRSPQFIPDQEKALALLMERIEHEPKEAAEETDQDITLPNTSWNPFLIKKYLFVAASFMSITFCSWFFRDSIKYKTYETAYGQVSEFDLGDGSHVALNANSRLKVPRFGFYGKVRTVSLDGEAEFSVSHTKDHKRFVVKTSDTFQVEVLGTQFSVFARPRGTKVALSHGEIRIDYSDGKKKEQMLMKPGDLATLQKTGEVALINGVDTQTLSAWKEQRFIFNETSLLEISNLIGDNFGKRIRISSEKLAQRTITGNFKTQDAEDLLKTVSEVLNLKIETAGNSILITDN